MCRNCLKSHVCNKFAVLCKYEAMMMCRWN